MSAIELQIVAGMLALMAILILCHACYRAGWRAADEEWLITATDPAKLLRFNGREYAAVELMVDDPNIESHCHDYGEFVPPREQPQHRQPDEQWAE